MSIQRVCDMCNRREDELKKENYIITLTYETDALFLKPACIKTYHVCRDCFKEFKEYRREKVKGAEKE